VDGHRRQCQERNYFDSISNVRIRGSNIVPAWKESLSEDDHWALTAYILSLTAAAGAAQ